MRVIGTAGHVDHGKSTLVRRLTGIEPDRWAEERARGLTIDLGFAWFDLPNGETVGIVDVPGHRDFIENMLAGIGGIDAALLVIAADEGVMPQTREHLAILDLLGVSEGIVLITKIDLITDPEWLDLVELDIHETLADTSLADAPILRISAHTGTGLDTLIGLLTERFAALPQRLSYNQPRLHIDRVFTVDGFGTVVTGTLSGGTLQVGDSIEIQPTALEGRVRGLQSYKQDVDVALPGSRVAVNLAGISKTDVQRGDVLAYPGQLTATQRIDVYFRHLPDADRPLKHNTEVKFFSGASETIATVRLLADEIVPPGAETWLQLRLRDSIPLTQHDRFILRYPSPAQTIGGGVIVDPHPPQRWKRFQAQVIERLSTRYQGTPAQRIAQAADTPAPQTITALQKSTALSADELTNAIETALADALLFHLPDDTYWSATQYTHASETLTQIVTQYHADFPLRLGMPREELRRRLSVANTVLAYLLDNTPDIIAEADNVRAVDHSIRYTQQQQKNLAQLRDQIAAQPQQPPSYKEAVALIGEDVLQAEIALGNIVQIATDVIFARDDLDRFIRAALEHIDATGTIDAKTLRDVLSTSRKYAIALLEYMDAQQITRRIGDERVRGLHAPD